MLGYGTTFGTYRLWDIEHQKRILGRNAIFNESSILNRSKIVEIIDSDAVTLSKDTLDEKTNGVNNINMERAGNNNDISTINELTNKFAQMTLIGIQNN